MFGNYDQLVWEVTKVLKASQNISLPFQDVVGEVWSELNSNVGPTKVASLWDATDLADFIDRMTRRLA